MTLFVNLLLDCTFLPRLLPCVNYFCCLSLSLSQHIVWSGLTSRIPLIVYVYSIYVEVKYFLIMCINMGAHRIFSTDGIAKLMMSQGRKGRGGVGFLGRGVRAPPHRVWWSAVSSAGLPAQIDFCTIFDLTTGGYDFFVPDLLCIW